MCSKCYRDSQLNAERKASNSKAAISALTEVPAFPDVPEVLGAKPAQSQPRMAQQAEPSVSAEVRDHPKLAASPSEKEGKKEEPGIADSAGLPERPAQRPGRCFTCNKKVVLALRQ